MASHPVPPSPTLTAPQQNQAQGPYTLPPQAATFIPGPQYVNYSPNGQPSYMVPGASPQLPGPSPNMFPPQYNQYQNSQPMGPTISPSILQNPAPPGYPQLEPPAQPRLQHRASLPVAPVSINNQVPTTNPTSGSPSLKRRASDRAEGSEARAAVGPMQRSASIRKTRTTDIPGLLVCVLLDKSYGPHVVTVEQAMLAVLSLGGFRQVSTQCLWDHLIVKLRLNKQCPPIHINNYFRGSESRETSYTAEVIADLYIKEVAPHEMAIFRYLLSKYIFSGLTGKANVAAARHFGPTSDTVYTDGRPRHYAYAAQQPPPPPPPSLIQSANQQTSQVQQFTPSLGSATSNVSQAVSPKSQGTQSSKTSPGLTSPTSPHLQGQVPKPKSTGTLSPTGIYLKPPTANLKGHEFKRPMNPGLQSQGQSQGDQSIKQEGSVDRRSSDDKGKRRSLGNSPNSDSSNTSDIVGGGARPSQYPQVHGQPVGAPGPSFTPNIHIPPSPMIQQGLPYTSHPPMNVFTGPSNQPQQEMMNMDLYGSMTPTTHPTFDGDAAFNAAVNMTMFNDLPPSPFLPVSNSGVIYRERDSIAVTDAALGNGKEQDTSSSTAQQMINYSPQIQQRPPHQQQQFNNPAQSQSTLLLPPDFGDYSMGMSMDMPSPFNGASSYPLPGSSNEENELLNLQNMDMDQFFKAQNMSLNTVGQAGVWDGGVDNESRH